jgi:hypothetical protein
MSARGVHFAVSSTQARKLLAARSDRKLMSLIEQIEDTWDEPFLVESDKAWDAIHRCLTDGSLLYESGEYPLNLCICGGRQLHRGDDYTVSFVSARQVKDVATALGKITRTGMRKRYALIDADDYASDIGEDDFAYTWQNFLEVRRFYRRAAKAGRAVLFTVDC